MSYICHNCGKAQEDGTKPNKVVVESRYATYKDGGEGREIVKEADLCDGCYSRWMKDHPVRIKMTPKESSALFIEALDRFEAKGIRLLP